MLIVIMFLSWSSLDKDFVKVGVKMMDKRWLIDIDVYLSDGYKLVCGKVMDRFLWDNWNVM